MDHFHFFIAVIVIVIIIVIVAIIAVVIVVAIVVIIAIIIIIVIVAAKEMPGLKPDLKQMLHFVRNSARPSSHSILCFTFSFFLLHFLTVLHFVSSCYQVVHLFNATFCQEPWLSFCGQVCDSVVL